MRVWPGKSYPLGATWDGAGVNFALFSEHATKVELCLFDSPESTSESRRIFLAEQTEQVWHAYLPGIQPDQLYGYRVHGPYEPAKGHRFNPRKLVLDPYAKAIGRDLTWDDSLFGYKVGDPQADLSLDDRDNAAFAPLASVIDPAFTWGDDGPQHTPWHKTLIYELHVKGFSQLMPDVPEKLQGTYTALASETAIKHLTDLDVTAVEFMPVHHHVDDRHLVGRASKLLGLQPPALVPKIRLCHWRPLRGSDAAFKTMVLAPARGGDRGDSRCRLQPHREGSQVDRRFRCGEWITPPIICSPAEDPRHYMDFTGCREHFNMTHPRVVH